MIKKIALYFKKKKKKDKAGSSMELGPKKEHHRETFWYIFNVLWTFLQINVLKY